MPKQKGQQSQPAAVQRRPAPPLSAEGPPTPVLDSVPQCIIFGGENQVGKLPVRLFDGRDWTCREAMKPCDFLPKENVTSCLYLGKNVDLPAALVFFEYVQLPQITNKEGGSERVFKLTAAKAFPERPFGIEVDINAMSQLQVIAWNFQMLDLAACAKGWIEKKYYSPASLPVASGTSSQKPAAGGKPEQSSNVEQPDDDEESDDDDKTVIFSPAS
ncbi:uncharacterized protein G6M90_00g077930 [Metarhizium brunneum]|uniref:Uncharacterized protein n=1 Tax=Metarhizium brunneum TaxID=500148 RepID=A0A7D5UZW1_9HYPO